MKIVMLCDFYGESLQYQENLLAKYYGKHGHDVVIIASTCQSLLHFVRDKHDNATQELISFDGKAKIVRLRYRFNILNRLRAFTNISKLLEMEQPDLIFVHDISLNIPEVVKYKRSHNRCRVIFDYHADYSNSGNGWLSLKVLHGMVRKFYLDRLRKYLSGVYPVTPAAARFLNDIYRIPYSEMELLPLGADIDQTRNAKENAEGKALRRSLGISDGAIVLLSGGKLAPAKKTELLLDAVDQIADPSLHLFVIGDSSEEDEQYKRTLLIHAKQCANVHFVGWLNQADILRHMDMADVAVFPASQSILWQQAISMELPLIVGDTGDQDISYLNQHGNILILKKSDITSEKLAETLRKVIYDKELRRTMSQGAKKVADEHLDWNKLILKTLGMDYLPSEGRTELELSAGWRE